MGRKLKTASLTAANRYEAIMNRTAQAFRDALHRLLRGTPTHPRLHGRPIRITPATVAIEARKSRNALYTNHKDILKEIQEVVYRPSPQEKVLTVQDKVEELREIIKTLTKEKKELLSNNATLFYELEQQKRENARLHKENGELIKKLDKLPVLLSPKNTK